MYHTYILTFERVKLVSVSSKKKIGWQA